MSGYALTLDGAGVIVDNRSLCCRGVAVTRPVSVGSCAVGMTWMALLPCIATTMDLHSGSSLSATQAEIEAPGRPDR
ncbi:hypothetical protein ACRS8P_02545 [Burkholderia cenocepacia]